MYEINSLLETRCLVNERAPKVFRGQELKNVERSTIS